jgi:hypothetical protein
MIMYASSGQLRIIYRCSGRTPNNRPRCWTMYLEAVSECVWRCTWILRSSELGDALRSRDCVSLEMLPETGRLSGLRDAFGGRN